MFIVFKDDAIMNDDVIINNPPPDGFTTLPPSTLVKTWLMLAYDTSEDMEYPRMRAISIIRLVFGSIDAAEKYLHDDNYQQAS